MSTDLIFLIEKDQIDSKAGSQEHFALEALVFAEWAGDHRGIDVLGRVAAAAPSAE